MSHAEGLSVLKWNDLQVNSFLLRCVVSVVPSTGVRGGVRTRKIFLFVRSDTTMVVVFP